MRGCHRDKCDKRPLAGAGHGACLHLVLSYRWPVTLVFDLFNASLSPKDVLAVSEIPGRGGGGRHSKQQLLATTRVVRKCRLEVDLDFVCGGSRTNVTLSPRKGFYAKMGNKIRPFCSVALRRVESPPAVSQEAEALRLARHSTASETLLACHSSSSKDTGLPQHCRQKHSLACQNARGKDIGFPRQCRQRRWSATTLLSKTLACQNLQAKTLAFHDNAGNDVGLTQHCW